MPAVKQRASERDIYRRARYLHGADAKGRTPTISAVNLQQPLQSADTQLANQCAERAVEDLGHTEPFAVVSFGIGQKCCKYSRDPTRHPLVFDRAKPDCIDIGESLEHPIDARQHLGCGQIEVEVTPLPRNLTSSSRHRAIEDSSESHWAMLARTNS